CWTSSRPTRTSSGCRTFPPRKRQPTCLSRNCRRKTSRQLSRPNSAAARGANRQKEGRLNQHGFPYPAYAPDGTATAEAKSARPQIIRQFELTEKVRGYDPRADTDMLDAAYVLAMQAHGAQTRENGDPYITHPLAVADILAGYRLDTASIITGLLHDVIEDTPCKLADIEQRFGPAIASLVDGVTKLTRLELQSDSTKQAENFRKLILAI